MRRCKSERDRVRDSLDQASIATGVHYPTPVHLQPAWRELAYTDGDLMPASERLAQSVVSLPVFPGMREDEIDRVGDALRHALRPPARPLHNVAG